MDRMESKKSCFCCPLKGGLLFLASIKLIIALLLVIFFIYGLVVILKRSMWSDAYPHGYPVAVIVVPLILWSIDIIFTIVLLCGALMKSVKILMVFNIYSVVLTILAGLWFSFLAILRVVAELNTLAVRDMPLHLIFGATPLLDIVIQTLFNLVIRAELMKLDDAFKKTSKAVASYAPTAPSLLNDVTQPNTEYLRDNY